MATTRPKLWLSTSKIRIINVVTLLMLSAVAVADEGNSTRQCYWCGPIAEQVQRSDVAPPCGPKNSVVFNCQEGYNYCAIAASSPPYMVSRFCSKVYQDECYPQYCNSTKVWRMTCTCRGDLCNENITKRETDAFATLPREVEAKETRDKRDTKNANFVLSDSEKTVIITNLSTVQTDVEAIKPEGNHLKKENEAENTQIIVSQPKVPVQIVTKDDDIVANDTADSESIELEDNHTDVLKKEDKIIKEDKVDRKNEITETSVKDILLSKVVVGTTKMTKEIETPVITNTARPSEKLPTAEALQQEASSENDDTNTEHTTVDDETTESSASNDDNDDDEHDHVTTEPSDADESSANDNSANMLLLANGLLLHFIYNRK
ncbi:uncharacterized protein [Epargyreus clarus]